MPNFKQTKRYEEIKRVMEACDGSVQASAVVLGISYSSLSRTLNSVLRSWWVPYKQKLKKTREKNRHNRWKQRVAQRQQDQTNEARAYQGLPPIYPWVNPEDYI